MLSHGPWFRLASRVAAIVSLGFLTLFAACSGRDDSADVSAGPYRAKILAAAKVTTSEFQRSILSDGVITEAEYEEAVGRTVACVADRGFTLGKKRGLGGYTYSIEGSPAADTAFTECAAKNSSSVEVLFNEQLVNPHRGDYYAILVECLKRKKEVPSSYTLEQFKREKDKQFNRASFDLERPGARSCFD
ncbi:MAG: hypothetical protein ACRC0L_08500, partial [Angustibacter sp.]